jgi:hypothetical protein
VEGRKSETGQWDLEIENANGEFNQQQWMEIREVEIRKWN